jgi:hypothetical protein
MAIDIAMQHVNEFPTYYDELIKMEAGLKKSHKKFKDVTEGKGLWANINARRKAGKTPKKPGEKGYPKTLDIEEGLKQARKNVGASKCWPGKVATKTKIKDGIEVPDCRSIKEETGMVRYCPKCQKDETRSECKYGPKFWALFSTPSVLTTNQMKYDIAQVHPANEGYDHEYSMARSELSTIISAVKRLQKKINKGEGNIEAWVQSKITKAADYIDTAADYVDSGEMKVEGVSFDIGSNHRQIQRRAKIHNKTRENTNSNEVSVAQSKLNEPKWSKPKLEKESVTIQDANGNDYVEFIDLIKPEKLKTFGQFMIEAKKSEMKCNSPKSEPVGDSLTGKSHVVKACEGGKEKLIRFGQRGVKGSPKKKGESKEYASRRHRFQTRHAKNIAKGKMSAAYWANKVKW